MFVDSLEDNHEVPSSVGISKNHRTPGFAAYINIACVSEYLCHFVLLYAVFGAVLNISAWVVVQIP